MHRLWKALAAFGVLQWALVVGYLAGRTISWHGAALDAMQLFGLFGVSVVLAQLIRQYFRPPAVSRAGCQWVMAGLLAYALLLVVWEPFWTPQPYGGPNLAAKSWLLAPVVAGMCFLLWAGEWFGGIGVTLF